LVLRLQAAYVAHKSKCAGSWVNQRGYDGRRPCPRQKQMTV
jgi:hypothetical protein